MSSSSSLVLALRELHKNLTAFAKNLRSNPVNVALRALIVQIAEHKASDGIRDRMMINAQKDRVTDVRIAYPELNTQLNRVFPQFKVWAWREDVATKLGQFDDLVANVLKSHLHMENTNVRLLSKKDMNALICFLLIRLLQTTKFERSFERRCMKFFKMPHFHMMSFGLHIECHLLMTENFGHELLLTKNDFRRLSFTSSLATLMFERLVVIGLQPLTLVMNLFTLNLGGWVSSVMVIKL